MEIEQISISQLSNLLKSSECDILQGKQKLSLTASLLQKINYTLQELEYNHVSNSNSTSIPEATIQHLQEIITKTPKLAVTQKIKRETWRVDLSRFSSLKYLELSRIPMHLVEGIQSLRSQLEVLICERCTDCLEEILGASNHIWEELHTAKLCYNDLVFLCPFLNTPCLQYLDLSYNKIEDMFSLQTLKNLKYLNLSFNYLTNVPMLSEEVCHSLKVLLINNNYIQELAIISMFDCLEVLDVSNNLLADHSAISPILFLPNLRSINLSCNPISYHPHHRFHTCSYLNKGVIPDEFLLDGKPLNLLEQKEIGRRGETYRQLGITLGSVNTCLPSSSISQPAQRSVSKKKVRDVIIEEGTSITKAKTPVKPLETSQEHLQSKRQVEELRERFGGEHWLQGQSGYFVQDLMGLQKSTGSGILSSTPSRDLLLPPSPNLLPPFQKAETGSPSRYDSTASEEYVTALTTQAIIEKVPSHVTPSDSSDQEPPEHLLSKVQSEGEQVSDVEPEQEGEIPADVTVVQAKQGGEDGGEEEEEDEGGQLWLVQKQGDEGLTELFLVLNEKEIREKSTITGRTTTKWCLESVKSCEKVNNDPPTIHIAFNTIRKAFQERTYVMEFPDAQEMLKRVRSFLEARSLSAMNQVAYRCMKCSSMFSVELQPTVFPSLVATADNGVSNIEQATKCPTCGSKLLVQLEEAPLPSTESEEDPTPNVDSSTTPPLKHSPSDCSIGSANSLEQRLEGESQSEVAKESTTNLRRYDSDIEVISNPSQSSIEVLEVQARLQGTVTPNRKRSSEERSTVAVPQLNTVPEVQSNMVALTESSSSGSLTDSVCTAYESNPVPARRSGMSDVPEEATPQSTPATTFSSLLEGLIQSVTSKLTPQNSPSLGSFLGNKMLYSFTDFSEVDHRVKFYLFENTFKDNNEELLFILRGDLVSLNGDPLPGCLVFSTHSIYILHVVAPEIGDDASHWFQNKACHHLTDLLSVFELPWRIGVGFGLGSTSYLTLMNDSTHTTNFLVFLKNLTQQENSTLKKVIVEDERPTKSEELLKQLVSCSVSASSGPVDLTPNLLVLCSLATTSKDKEDCMKLVESPLLLTTTELLLIKPNFGWLLPPGDPLPQCAARQKLANIIELTSAGRDLNIHFLNETENHEEVWSLELSSRVVVNRVVESLRGPWEQLFSVPLQLQLSNKH